MAAWPDLDRTDFEILRLLQKDARLTNKELASAVELAPSSTHERVKRLWDVGVLRGLHAEVDLHALGIDGDVAADGGDQIISQRIKLRRRQIRAVMNQD